MAEHAHHPAAYDDEDPHHEIAHHGHVILSPRTLLAVLFTLLFFTIATVAASRLEVWIASAFHIEIPQIVNVLIAMSIAVVKAVLVGMFFMQLKYDNPLHSVLMLFCIFAVGLFLFFSMTDLSTRGAVYAYKSGEIQKGGMGLEPVMDKNGKQLGGINTDHKAIVVWARERRIKEIDEQAAQGTLKPPLAHGETAEMRWEKEAEVFHAAHGVHKAAANVSTANKQVRSAPGPTPDLMKPDAEVSHESEGHGH